MLEGISEYQAIQHAITESCSSLFARKHLLAMLLASAVFACHLCSSSFWKIGFSVSVCT